MKTIPVYTTASHDLCAACGDKANEQGYCLKHAPITYTRRTRKITITGRAEYNTEPILHSTPSNRNSLLEVLGVMDTPIVRYEVREIRYGVSFEAYHN